MADSERDRDTALAEVLERLARILEGRGINRNDPHVNRQVNALAALVRAAQPSAEPGLASPADPAPEALVEARDEAAYWRTQAIEAEGLARALV